MTHEPAKHALDQADPHHELPHEHVIVRAGTLVIVLLVLLVLTVLTVGQAQGESFLSATFGVHFPPIFNVLVVMGIAVVKASIVALFFMQLRYDNPLNAIVFLFCLFAVALFLGFTMIDLGNRGIVNPVKAPEIQAGGLGLSARVNTGGLSLVDHARMQRIDHITNLSATGQLDLKGLTPYEYYETVDKPRFAHGHAAHDDHARPLSTPNASIPPVPVGPSLFQAHHAPADHAPAH